MNKIIKVLIASMLIITSINIFANEVEATVTIPDENLRQCVKSKIGVSADVDITIARMNAATGSFTCEDKGVVNLTGLEHFTGVSYISLSENSISDISVVDWNQLTNLSYLVLSENQIVDISSLGVSGLADLRYLYLDTNQISSINTVNWSLFSNLRGLYLDYNQIGDINGLSSHSLGSLRVLNLDSNNISDISSLDLSTTAPDLRSLFLERNQISNVGSLSSTVSPLQTLDLNTNELSDLDNLDLSNLTSLGTLLLEGNGITDISKLGMNSTPDLAALNIGHNPITNIETLDFSNFPLIRDLYMHNITTSDLSRINWHTLSSTLYWLDLNQNGVSDLSKLDLSYTPNLGILELSRNEISDLSPLDFNLIPNLAAIGLDYNQIYDLNTTDWTPLTNLRNLWAYNQVVTIPAVTIDTPTYVLPSGSASIVRDPDGTTIDYNALTTVNLDKGETKTETVATWWEEPVKVNGIPMNVDPLFTGVVKQEITRINPLAIDASDFRIHLDDVGDLDELLAKLYSYVSAHQNQLSGGKIDLTGNVITDLIELGVIQNTPVVGVFPLTFTINNLGETETVTIQVTVYDDEDPVSPPKEPETLSPTGNSSNYIYVMLLIAILFFFRNRIVNK